VLKIVELERILNKAIDFHHKIYIIINTIHKICNNYGRPIQIGGLEKMNNKIIGILVIILLITTAILPVIGIENLTIINVIETKNNI
jgi:hypothetical protein